VQKSYGKIFLVRNIHYRNPRLAGSREYRHQLMIQFGTMLTGHIGIGRRIATGRRQDTGRRQSRSQDQ